MDLGAGEGAVLVADLDHGGEGLVEVGFGNNLEGEGVLRRGCRGI